MGYFISLRDEVRQITEDALPVGMKGSYRGRVRRLVSRETGQQVGVGLVVPQVREVDESSPQGAGDFNLVLMHLVLFRKFPSSGDFQFDGAWWCLDRAESGQARLRRWDADKGGVLEDGPTALAHPLELASVSVEHFILFMRKLRDETYCMCGGIAGVEHHHSLAVETSVLFRGRSGRWGLMSAKCFDQKVHRGEMKRSDAVIDGRAIPPFGRVQMYEQIPSEMVLSALRPGR